MFGPSEERFWKTRYEWQGMEFVHLPPDFIRGAIMTQAIKGYSYRETAFPSSGQAASASPVPGNLFDSNPCQGDAAEMLRKLKEEIAKSGNTPATASDLCDLQEKMMEAARKQQEARKLYDQDLFTLNKHIAEFSRTDSPIAKVVAEKLTEKLKELGLSTPAF